MVVAQPGPARDGHPGVLVANFLEFNGELDFVLAGNWRAGQFADNRRLSGFVYMVEDVAGRQGRIGP